MAKPEKKEWSKSGVASTLAGAAGVALLAATGQIVLASGAAVVTYLFGGKLRKRARPPEDGH